MNRREPTASPFRDLSNLRTPKRNPKSPSPLLFTASKTTLPAPTPTPLRRRRPTAGAATPTPLGRRLRALELDQSRSARRAESGRERALRNFATSSSSWLSLLLRDPSACNCSPAAADTAAAASASASALGKRDELDGERARGSSPKRHRGGDRCGQRRKAMTPATTAALRESMREVCSLEDLTERMGKYMSTEACEEVLVMMCQICKNIDENRLKMKAHCPLATDLRLKGKATTIFLCYNPEWLRIGLHIVLGGDSLLQNGSRKRDKEVSFLKLILEKQLFAQNVTAKSFAHNKMVEGPHRPSYTETEVLGNIILKRIFLLVAALDRAKMERALPLKSGIDGIDGGSPPLFCHQAHIRSSREVIQVTLGEVMHGEGDFLMHLTTMGYKLNYQQLALSEYDFTIGNLFEDLQDGIILCRVVQLLLSDASIILKVIAPSDTHKKKLHNCTMAIQYIKQAGVPITDADGVTISPEDIASGDKELILSLLWNMFIHMQLPLLANKTSLARELSRLKAPVPEQSIYGTKSHTGLLYDWIQVICAKYGMSVENYSHIDRRALNYFINYYLNINIHRCPLKEIITDCRKELFSCHEPDNMTDISNCPSSNIGKVLADFLQEFPASGILANDVLFDEKSAIVLLAFLSSHLTSDKRLEQLRNLINARLDYGSLESKVSTRCQYLGDTDGSCTSQELAATIIQTQARRIIAQNKYHKLKRAMFILQGAMRAWSAVSMKSKCSCLNAAVSTPRQANGNYNRYFILILERHRFVQMRRSAIVIQQAVRIWIRERNRHGNIEPFESYEFSDITTSKTGCTAPAPQELCNGAIESSFINSVSHQFCEGETSNIISATDKLVFKGDVVGGYHSSRVLFQHEQPVSTQLDFCKDVMAARRIQSAYRRFLQYKSSRMSAATKIQSHWRGLSMRTCFRRQVQAIVAIQVATRHISCRRAFQRHRHAAIVIQRFARGYLARKWLLVSSSLQEVMAARKIQFAYRRFVQNRSSRLSAAIKIQSHWRGLSLRTCFIRQVQAVVAIQAAIRQTLCYRAFQRQRHAAIVIQRFAEGRLARKRLLGSSSLQAYTSLCAVDQSQHKRSQQSIELKIVVYSVLRLQRWWRKVQLQESIRMSAISIQSFVRGWLARKQANRITCCIYFIQRWWRKVMFLESRKKAVVVIQSHVRGRIARQTAIIKRKRITVIQSFVKSYLVRKASKQEVADVRSRVQKSCAQVDDDMRLINRLVAALSQLIHCRSISSIRQTCATLSIATEHSKKCCETLVGAGAVDIMLKQIHLLNRGIPDQEVLKQVLFTLRNIAQFPNLRPVLANTPRSVEIIFQELLRNKAEGFFIACDILKKLCESKEGHGIATPMQHHTRRLGNLVQDLEKKVELDKKRNGRTGARKENNLRRLGEAVTLYHLLTDDR